MRTMHYPNMLRKDVQQSDIVPLIGVYDVFSASIAARYYKGIFVSGYSFAASFYGLPDVGFISWSDISAFVQRVRTILPAHHIVVDVDDGYCDTDVACFVTSLLEEIGASGIILEDQQRPRRCGHVDGKQILELNEFMVKLEKVLQTRKSLFVVARTDATDPDEIIARVKAFSETSVDAILADGISDLGLLKKISHISSKPVVFNQIYGGKSPAMSLSQLSGLGVSIVNYSIPCLAAAQSAIDNAMYKLSSQDGLLTPDLAPNIALKQCNGLLSDNLTNRNRKVLKPEKPVSTVVE